MLQTQPAVYLYSLSTAVDGEGRGCALQGGDGGGAGVGGGGGGGGGGGPVQQEPPLPQPGLGPARPQLNLAIILGLQHAAINGIPQYIVCKVLTSVP